MSLHIFSVVLISISSNTDSFAVAIAYGIKQVRITHLANFMIAIISSVGTFASMSLGAFISDYLSRSSANTLGSGVLIAIGLVGQTIEHEHKRRKIRQLTQPDLKLSIPVDLERLTYHQQPDLDLLVKDTQQRRKYLKAKQALPLAFSLTINNIGGGIGAGISGLNATLTTVVTFGLALLAMSIGSSLGKKFARQMTEFWAGILSASLIILLGIYEYFN